MGARNSTLTGYCRCGSLQIWGITAIAAISGKLFDLGYCRRVVWSGSALLVFAIFMTSLCHELWQFIIAQGFLAGIAMGTVFVPSVSATSHYFKKRRSLAMGLVASGSSVGGVILPIQMCATEPAQPLNR
jgi:MFS family permease